MGDIARWKARGRLQDTMAHCHFLDLPELDACTIRRCNPGLVLSPLMADGFDAIDVAERLQAAGFAGRYRVLADALPDPDLIRREIRALAPALDFDLLVLPGLPS
ncbi:MAG: hypothetical protein ACK4TM_06775 [Yoonia sp.]